MSFVGSFTIAQNSPSTITLTDNSTGTDANITSRTVTLTKYDNTTLYTTTWDISDTSITFTDVLVKDYGLYVTVTWNSTEPDPANTYTVTLLAEFDMYGLVFLGQLITENLARYPIIRNDTNFMGNFFKFYSYIVSARISTGLTNDIFKTQFVLDLATDMRNNQTKYF